MAKKCELTGVGPMSGNNVSHSNRKTRRRFLPNMQVITYASEALGRNITLRLTAASIRTVEHNGGLDAYLASTADSKLTVDARKLKRQVKKALSEKAAA